MYAFTGWWASDAEPGATTAYSYDIKYYCDMINPEVAVKADGLSVRCVRD
jgi:hypothetical protein